MELDECYEKGYSKEAQPNEERIISLLKIAAKKEQFVATTELSVNSSSILFVIAYESLREVMEAYCLQNRKLVLNHICLGEFIASIDKDFDARLFDIIRRSRNSVNYYGKEFSLQRSKQLISKCFRLKQHVIKNHFDV